MLNSKRLERIEVNVPLRGVSDCISLYPNSDQSENGEIGCDYLMTKNQVKENVQWHQVAKFKDNCDQLIGNELPLPEEKVKQMFEKKMPTTVANIKEISEPKWVWNELHVVTSFDTHFPQNAPFCFVNNAPQTWTSGHKTSFVQRKTHRFHSSRNVIAVCFENVTNVWNDFGTFSHVRNICMSVKSNVVPNESFTFSQTTRVAFRVTFRGVRCDTILPRVSIRTIADCQSGWMKKTHVTSTLSLSLCTSTHIRDKYFHHRDTITVKSAIKDVCLGSTKLFAKPPIDHHVSDGRIRKQIVDGINTPGYCVYVSSRNNVCFRQFISLHVAQRACPGRRGFIQHGMRLHIARLLAGHEKTERRRERNRIRGMSPEPFPVPILCVHVHCLCVCVCVCVCVCLVRDGRLNAKTVLSICDVVYHVFRLFTKVSNLPSSVLISDGTKCYWYIKWNTRMFYESLPSSLDNMRTTIFIQWCINIIQEWPVSDAVVVVTILSLWSFDRRYQKKCPKFRKVLFA